MGGTIDAPGESYKSNRVVHIAQLTLAPDGTASGPVRFVYSGVTALRWRQASLTGDDASLKRRLTEECESLLGKTLDVHIVSIEHLTDYEQPLIVNFTVHGPIASSAGRRILIGADLFEALRSPTFPGKDRKYGVYFHYPTAVQDVVNVHLPAGYTIESIPDPAHTVFEKTAAYTLQTEQTATSYTIRRDFLLGNLLYRVEDYPVLRTFYTTFETKDHEPVVLKPTAN
jgi:hypothetical protein